LKSSFLKSNSKPADHNSTEKLSVTEALTKRRLQLVTKANKIFGFKNVWTAKGKVFVNIKK